MGESVPTNRAWAYLACAVAICFVVAGGTSAPTALARLCLSAISLVAIAAAAWRLRLHPPTTLGRNAIALIAAMLALMLAQQLMLPASWGAALPGRGTFAAQAAELGINPLRMAWSLDPAATRDTLLATLPGIAMFALALACPARNRLVFAGTIAAVAVVSAILGMVQRFTASETWYLYDPGTLGMATGFFANRNFLAALLYTSIPMLGALTLAAVREQKMPGWLGAALGLAYLLVILGGLAATASRAGIILCMAAIIATALLPWSSLTSLRTRASKRVMIYGMLAFMFIFSQFGLAGLLRLAATDPLTDYRSTISHVSWTAAKAMLPMGSGFGTFVPVYQMFETPADIRPEYVNHAHNDWLELVLEGGIPAMVLLAAFLGLVGMASVRIWMRRSEAPVDLVMTASSISVALLLLHSAIDFPLRTPALMGLMGLCCGFMVSNFVVRRRHASQWDAAAAAPQVFVSPVVRKPFKPFQPAQAEDADKPGAQQ